MIEGRRVFITGGAGFIGSRLAERLRHGNEVTLYDNLERDAMAHRSLEAVTLVEGDVLDIDGLREAMAGHDLVVHCAAIAGITAVSERPVTTMRVNMIGSANVLQAADEIGDVARVVCFSTSEVFGQRAIDVSEDMESIVGPPGEPRWTYAVSKLAEEHLALAYNTERGLPTVVVRPFNVYGPGQVGEGAIERFTKKALAGEPLQIRGDGAQVRSWCYVDDMVEGVMLAMARPEAVGNAFNIGNPRATTTIGQLARDIVRMAGSSSPIEHVPGVVDVRVRVPDIAKAQAQLGFEPRVDLDEGVERTIKHLRDS